MGWLVRLALFGLIFVAAYVLVQRFRAGREAALLAEIVRLARAQGSLELVDVCRSFGVRPAQAEALLAALVERGELRAETTAQGGTRWRLAEAPRRLPEPPDDDVVH